MATDPKDGSILTTDNIIPVTLDDLSEDQRRELEQKLEDQKAEGLKLMLAEYSKTRSGAVVKKVMPPSPSSAANTKVSNATEEIAHLIDASVASKYGSDMANTTHAMMQLTSKLDEFKDDLPRQVRSVVLQNNDEYRGKQQMPTENLSSHSYTPGASANIVQPHITLNNNQNSRNCASTSANEFLPSVAPPIVSTSVPQTYDNRSISFNSNLRQPSYQTVAYSTTPSPPVGTGIPYGPVPESYFNVSPQQTTHQTSLPEMPPRTFIPSVPQVGSPQPTESFKDQLANILREFGLEPKGRARAYQKPYPDHFDLTPYPRGFRIPDFVKFTGEDGRSTFEHVGQFLAQCSEIGTSDVYRVKLFPLSLSGTAFTWFTSLAPNSVSTWIQLEQKFHEYFYSGETELRLSDLTMVKQKHNEHVHDYIRRFRDVKNHCFSLNIAEKDLADLVFSGLLTHIKETRRSTIFRC